MYNVVYFYTKLELGLSMIVYSNFTTGTKNTRGIIGPRLKVVEEPRSDIAPAKKEKMKSGEGKSTRILTDTSLFM